MFIAAKSAIQMIQIYIQRCFMFSKALNLSASVLDQMKRYSVGMYIHGCTSGLCFTCGWVDTRPGVYAAHHPCGVLINARTQPAWNARSFCSPDYRSNGW